MAKRGRTQHRIPVKKNHLFGVFFFKKYLKICYKDSKMNAVIFRKFKARTYRSLHFAAGNTEAT